MANDFVQTIGRLSNKASLILEKCRRLEAELTQAHARIDELERQTQAQRAQIERLNLDNEYLRMATTVTPDREHLEKTRATVRNLVKEIDRCIQDLTD